MIRTITYDKALYSCDALYTGREIYTEYGEITIEDRINDYKVIISTDTDIIDQLVGEFNNYLIYIEATQGL